MSSGAARDIIRAAKQAWDASSGISGLTLGGPFREEAPPGEGEFPYVVARVPVNTRRSTTNKSEYWDHTLVFEIYDRTPEAVEDHIAELGAIFDDEVLVLSIGSVLYLRRVDEPIAGPDAKSVWRGTLKYEILRSKPRQR